MIKVFSNNFYRSIKKENYYASALSRSQGMLTESVENFSKKASTLGITVFISHKHDDLEELKPLIALLEEKYGVDTYIDSQDKSMPKTTNAETANRIKTMISCCNKFILLATNGAIDSKWCNWELGYGDAKKYKNGKIAIFPFASSLDSFKGSEYMKIYPHIVWCDENEIFFKKSGTYANKGFHVVTESEGKSIWVELSEWLKK